MKLADRLAELRREHAFTLRQLRDRIEERSGERLSVSYLSELERTGAAPTVEALARIARGYDLSLKDLLAPVDFFDGQSMGEYPKGLRAFVEKEKIDEDWLPTLARIEFRGHRPETEDEWRAIYAMLKALIEPRLRE